MASTDFVTEAQIDALAAAIATSVNARKTATGDLASLATTAKSSLVAAINEVFAAAGGTINDSTTSTGTTWSSTKIADAVAAAVTSILGPGVGSAYDTLKELQTALEGDDTDISGLLTAVGNRLRFDAAQTLTSPQKAQALTNLGIVASTSNFAAAYTTAVA